MMRYPEKIGNIETLWGGLNGVGRGREGSRKMKRKKLRRTCKKQRMSLCVCFCAYAHVLVIH